MVVGLSMRRLLATTFAAVGISACQAHDLESSGRQMHLRQLNEATDVLTDNPLVNEENRERARKLSASVRKTMKSLRGGTPEFYNDLYYGILVLQCDNKIKTMGPSVAGPFPPNQRFVPSTSIWALKDESGNCKKLSNPEQEVASQYNSNFCEVKPNCFWRDFDVSDQDRRPVYSIEEAMLPPDGAVTLVKAKQAVQKWVTGIGMFVVPGIVLAVLSLLTMILFILCRCCCNKCGGREPKEEGYTCTQKVLPLGFFVFFSIGIVATAAFSLLFNDDVTSSVSAVFFVTVKLMNETTEFIDNATLPLVNIKDSVISAVDTTNAQISGSTFIDNGLNGITSRLDEFQGYTADVTLPRSCVQGAPCFPCEVCQNVSNDVATAKNQMDAAASTGIQQLKDIRGTLSTDLIGIKDSIKNQVNTNYESAEDMKSTIDASRVQVTKIEDIWDAQDSYRGVGVLAMFALAIVVIVVGLVGVIFGLTPLRMVAVIIHAAYMIGFIALFISFMVAAIMIAISVLLADTCEIIDLMRQDWEPVMGPDASLVMNACFQNTSLLEAFNLTASFNFADSLQFPSLELSSMLDFSDFDTFGNTINGTDSSTFNLDSSQITTLLSTMNTYTGQNVANCAPQDSNYTKGNVRQPWTANNDNAVSDGSQYILDKYDDSKSTLSSCANPSVAKPFTCGAVTSTTCNFKTFVKEVWTNTTTMVQVEEDSAVFVNDMKTNMSNIITYVDTFKANITSMDQNVSQIQTELTGSLIKYVGDFKGAMFCGFVGTNFDLMFDVLCGVMMPSLTMISLMVFLMGVFLIPVNITLIVLCKRLRASGNGNLYPGGNNDDDDDDEYIK